MEQFFAQALRLVPKIRTVAQLGFALLVVLAVLVLHATSQTPPLALIFIFAVVPLIIAMQFVKNLKPVLQFVCVMVISAMALAFLGTGIALSLFEKTPQYDTAYRTTIEPVEQELDQRYLVDNEKQIADLSAYPDYRTFILGIAKADKSQALKSGLSQVISFYDDYLQCRARLQCTSSGIFDQRIVDFWYSFRPIIEERRISLWGQDYGQSIQQLAEAMQPPQYASKVVVDEATGATRLASLAPLA